MDGGNGGAPDIWFQPGGHLVKDARVLKGVPVMLGSHHMGSLEGGTGDSHGESHSYHQWGKAERNGK